MPPPKRKSSSSSSSRPQRERKAIRPYFQELAFRNGEVEQTVEEACGLNQPGGTVPTVSKYEPLGYKAWKEHLSPAGWCSCKLPSSDLHNSHVFYIGPPKSKSLVDRVLQEGVTKFTGYEALGRQFEKDKGNGATMVERARKAMTEEADARSAQRLVVARGGAGLLLLLLLWNHPRQF